MTLIRLMMPTLLVFLVALGMAPGGRLAGQEGPGKRYAVLVGINQYQYPNLDWLRYAENDVTELADLLRGAGTAASS
jgi:hypothetical protein